MRLILIHNPSAGSGHPDGHALVDLLRSLGHEVVYQSRKAPGLEEAVAGAAEAIVLAGGDGTVSKLLPMLADRGLPIGILPLGTANNLARCLGIQGPLSHIMAGWDPATTRDLDLGVVRTGGNVRLFIDSAGFGALACAMRDMHRADTPPGTDKLARARDCIRRAVASAPPGDPGLTADGASLPPDLLLAEVANISRLGPGLMLAPQADPSDGRLDLVYARAGHRPELVEWLRTGAPGPAPLAVRRVRSVGVERPSAPFRVGDAFDEDVAEPVTIGISERVLRMLVSPAAPP